MIKGRPYRGELAGFAEKVLFLDYKKPRGGDMRRRWILGIWLGKLWKSDEHFIGTPKGIHRAAAIRALPPGEAWDVEEVEKIKATPWNFDPKEETPGTAIPVPEGELRREPEATRPAITRGMRVELKDIR